MPTGAEQAAVIRNLAVQGQYADAYRYTATQIDSNSAWDSRLPGFFERAALINQPGNNFYKDWVFTSNALQKGWDPENASSREVIGVAGGGGGSMAMFAEIEQSYVAGGPTDLEYPEYGMALF